MNTLSQLEFPLNVTTSAQTESKPLLHLDWPLKPLPSSTMDDLRRLSTRWGRGQTVRSLRLHGIR